MLEIVFDRLVRIMSTSPAQLHLRQCRGRHRQHPVAALRRLSELDPAAGDARGVQGRGMGQLRPDGGRFSAMIYSIVDVLLGGRRGTAAMRIEGRPYTTIERTLVERLIQVVLADLSGQLRPAVPGDVPLRAAGDQSALRHHQPAVQRRRAGAAADRHGGPRRAAGAAAALRHAGAGARAAAAAVHGRKVRPRFDLGDPSGRGAVEHRRRPRRRAGRADHAAGATSSRCSRAAASC